MVHQQVLVIYPKDVKLEDVMYPYQEIDKFKSEKLGDNRCQFFKSFGEEEIPNILNKIEKYIKKNVDYYLEIVQYRAKHSYSETYLKYDYPLDKVFDYYVYYTKKLNYFNEIKDLEYDNPKLIQFILDYCWYATDKRCDIYIKDIGYGHFTNPYQIWDYWTVVDERVFAKGTNFLISKYKRDDGNQMPLEDIDVKKTVQNIKNLTVGFEYLIFCKDEPLKSEIYTTDDVRFNYDWNKHCRIKDIESKLIEIQNKYSDKGYIVTALDFHW